MYFQEKTAFLNIEPMLDVFHRWRHRRCKLPFNLYRLKVGAIYKSFVLLSTDILLE